MKQKKELTRKERVIKFMRSRRTWVPGHELTHPDVGGTEGLRRLREAREDGLNIQKRRMKGSTSYEYRIARA